VPDRHGAKRQVHFLVGAWSHTTHISILFRWYHDASFVHVHPFMFYMFARPHAGKRGGSWGPWVRTWALVRVPASVCVRVRARARVRACVRKQVREVF
jgi:hypothetical protein